MPRIQQNYRLVIHLLGLCAMLSGVALAAERPNVVLVMTDDQGYGDVGCLGNKFIKTPAIDRFHSQSLRLTNFHVDPTCSPTRAALMTGRYSCRTGVWHTIQGRSIIRGDETTLANLFSQAGYQTGIFGKWHLGDNYPSRPQDQGFHRTLIHGGGGIGQTPDLWGNRYSNPDLLSDGKRIKTKGYCTNVFFDGAIRFIEKNSGKPFFVYIPTNVAHGPFEIDEKYSEPFKQMGLEDKVARFYGMLANLDENFDRLLKKLDQLGLSENTIVIFMTDNGSAIGHHNANMRGHKGSIYEGGHRVPCFIRWPGKLPAGKDFHQLTAHIDLLPTLAEACGVQRSETLDLDGKSLIPLFVGKSEWPERTLFVESHRLEMPQPYRMSVVMTDQYRLVEGQQLYDIIADPMQEKDLAKEKPAVVASLRKAYDSRYKKISSRFGEYCRIELGSRQANPTHLTCHDWHGEKVPWHQSHVRKSLVANGYWAVEVLAEGHYAITLRSRPAETKYPLDAASARIKIAGVEKTKAVKKGATSVTFQFALKAGKTRLQTWLSGGTNDRGAFFIEVRRLDEHLK